MSLGHRPVNVKRALIGSKGGWKLSVSSIIPMMDKTQVNSDCEFYDIYRLLIFLTKCGPYDAMAPSQNY